MDTLQLTNYRRFKDTGVVHLKPITFLVGANSSGKSSFLKFFPLLKQSLGVNRNGTFLWYSKDVDFKDFLNTVHDGEGNIHICFTFPLQNNHRARYRFRHINERKDSLANIEIKDSVELCVKLEISAKQLKVNTNEDYLSQLIIEYLDQVINIQISESGRVNVIINDRNIDTVFHTSTVNNSMFLIPRIIEDSNERLFATGISKARSILMEMLKTKKDRQTVSLIELEDYFYMLNKQASAKFLKNNDYRGDEALLNDMYILFHLYDIIDSINDYLFDLSSSITYVRPLRVTTERYYRYQNYAVDEIESDGKNLAMYFANLSDKQMIKFTDWTSKLFDFSIRVLKHEGHIELQICEGDEQPRNLVDTGFGYTQLLPIVTMIWNAINQPSRRIIYTNRENTPKLIVIEQPELHLHPKLQAKFGAMLAKVITDGKGKDVKFIIETHSEAILNSVGIQIENHVLNNDNVNVVLFNAKAQGYDNYVEEAKYNERGFIEHWPTGFLSEDVY